MSLTLEARKHPGTRWSKLLVLGLLLGSAWAAPQKGFSDQECLGCHSNAGLTKEVNGKQVSLDVHQDKFQVSVHGPLGCTGCHGDVKAFPHDPAPVMPACGSCHSEESAAYDRGFHAKAVKQGDTKAAGCIDCHGGAHEILPASDPNSKVYHANIPATCGACHGQKFVMDGTGHSAQTFVNYQESVHGKAVAQNGGSKAAVCTDCHGSHEILSAGDPKSPIFKFNVPATCAKCHGPIEQEYLGSIHGQAVSRGNWQAPVCTDCHGIHTIKAPTDPNSSVAAQALARTTCARCHESVRLSQEFGFEGRRASTSLASYHGLAAQVGSNVVANCASCHGVHNILPSSDPRSTINKANLITTCGQCHPGIGAKFIQGKVHVDAPLSADIGSVAVRWIRRFYLSMILVVIGGMLLHNALIWWRKAVIRRAQQRRIVLRMDRNQRVQHLVLLLSFFTLVVTGFALKYPDSWFAALLGMNETVRSILHRTAGGVLIGIGFYHVVYLAASRQGHRLLRDMMPVSRDAFDVLGAMRHYLGSKTERPRFGRFSYAEKAEYWALVWGTVVMASTGLALWFKVRVGDLLPRWWLDVATAIHFYEAVLATLAIVVWHFYLVMFDPDTYPMNWAWYDGRMPVEHYQEEHPLDSESVVQGVEAAAASQAETAAPAGSEPAGTPVPEAAREPDEPVPGRK